MLCTSNQHSLWKSSGPKCHPAKPPLTPEWQRTDWSRLQACQVFDCRRVGEWCHPLGMGLIGDLRWSHLQCVACVCEVGWRGNSKFNYTTWIFGLLCLIFTSPFSSTSSTSPSTLQLIPSPNFASTSLKQVPQQVNLQQVPQQAILLARALQSTC